VLARKPEKNRLAGKREHKAEIGNEKEACLFGVLSKF
jgi:hypothetical protein